jgi:hypothetical protein
MLCLHSCWPSSAVHPPADAAKDHSALLQRFEGVTAELSRVKEGAADMRLRLEHLTGPGGPQARIRQLEGSLQSVSGVCCTSRVLARAYALGIAAAAAEESLGRRCGSCCVH